MASSVNNLGTAYIRIAPQMQGIQSSIQSKLSGVGSKVGEEFSNGFTKKWGIAVGAVAGITNQVVSKAIDTVSSSIDGAISRVDTLNVFPKIMANLGYEADESSSSLDKLSNRIEGLPTTLDEIVNYTQRLASTMGSLNKGTRNATNLALAFNDAALAGGKGQAEANRAFEQFVQVISRGRPSMQDWKIMMEVMPGQLKQMAKYMASNNDSLKAYAKQAGKTADQLDGMDLYSWISEDKNEHAKERLSDLIDAMIALDTEGGAGITAFKDQVGDATHTIGTALRLIPVRVTKALAQVIQAFGAGDIYTALDKFTSGFKKVGDWAVKYVVPPLRDDIIPVLSKIMKAVKNVAQAILGNETARRALIIGLEIFLSYKAVAPIILGLADAIVKLKTVVTAGNPAMVSMGLAVTAVVASINVAIEATNLYMAKNKSATIQLRNYEKTLVNTTNAQRQLTKAEQLEQELLDDITTKKQLQNNAEYQALQAKQNLAQAQSEYNQMLKEGGHSEDELRMKQLEVMAASNAKTQAEQKYAESVKDTQRAIDAEADARLTSLHAHNQAQGAMLLEKREYATLAKQLDDLTKNTIEYTDANGNLVKVSKERMAEISNWYAESLGKNDATWKAIVTLAQKEGISFVEAANRYGSEAGAGLPGNFSKAVATYKPMALRQTQEMVDEIKGTFNTSSFFELGQNIIKGLTNGMMSLGKTVANKSQEIASTISNKMKSVLQVHSPSRVMFDVGRFVDLGLINGMESLSDRVEGAAEGLAQSIRDPFEQQATMNMMANSTRNAQAIPTAQTAPTQPQVIQNNTFNQVADNLDVKEASKLLGFEVATAI